jgi:hypothetical protein
MPTINIALASKTSATRFGIEADGRLVNMVAEPLGSEGKKQFALYPVDGLERLATIPNATGIRALLPLVQDNRLYGVAGRDVFSIGTSGDVTVFGGIVADGFTTMAANKRQVAPQIALTASGSNFLITSGVAVPIADTDLPPANSVCEIDNYFVWTLDDGRFFASALGDGSSIDPLSFAEAESKSDRLVRGYPFNRQLLLFGTETTEFWTNTGGEDFPFTRESANEVGCLAPASVATVDQSVMFVSADGMVRRIEGYQARRVSDLWVERAIADDPSPTALTALSWTDRGHIFYALSGTRFTAVYDHSTQLWAERRSLGFERWNVGAATVYGGRTVFGSSIAGHLFHASPTLATEDGAVIMCQAQCPISHGDGARLSWDAVTVEVVPSTLLDGTPGNSPLIEFDYSDDGGRNWSAKRLVSAATAGTRLGRVPAFRRLGVAPATGRILRFTVDAAMVRAITRASADVQPLRS